jgi:hypothetical protein
MALSLVDTAGSASANTYCSLADAETYFEGRLHKTNWDGADDADKNAALVWATRLLDQHIVWEGVQHSSSQALAWPRSFVLSKETATEFSYLIYLDSSTIPTFLKEATAEFAFELIKKDRTLEPDTKGYRWMKVGPISIESNRMDRPHAVPQNVYSMIASYGTKRVSATRSTVRV